MKTPREILAEKHKAATPKLDAIRRESVEQCQNIIRKAMEALPPSPPSGERAGMRGRSVLQLIWYELFLPSRRIWTGLTAIWIVILAVNFSMRDQSGVTMAKSTTPEMVQSFKQQQQLLAQLIGPSDPTVAEPPKSYTPRPSSQRFPEMLTA